MKNKFYKVGFMISVFMLMHAIPFAEVSAETSQGDGFYLGNMDGDDCIELTSTVVLQRANWNEMCIGYDGDITQARLFELRMYFDEETSIEPIAETHIVLHENSDIDWEFSFYTPADIITEVINFEIDLLDLRSQELIEETTKQYSILVPLVDHSHIVIIDDEFTIAQQSIRPLQFQIYSNKSLGEYNAIAMANGNEIVGNVSGMLESDGYSYPELVLNTSKLELGANSVTIQTSFDGAKDDTLVNTQITVIVEDNHQPDVEILGIDWSDESLSTIHPGQNASISVDGFSYSTNSSEIYPSLNCGGDTTFELSNELYYSNTSEFFSDVDFVIPQSANEGIVVCRLTILEQIYPLRNLIIEDWPVKLEQAVGNISTANENDDAYGLMIRADDENLEFNYKISNIGEITEYVQWDIFAKATASGETVNIQSGTAQIDTSDSTLIPISSPIQTCSSTNWNLHSELTDRNGEKSVLTMIGAFNTSREPYDIAISQSTNQEMESISRGVPVTMDINVNTMQDAVCSQTRSLQLIVYSDSTGEDDTQLAVYEHQIQVNPGSNSYSFDIDTSSIEHLGRIWIESQIVDYDVLGLQTRTTTNLSSSVNLISIEESLTITCPELVRASGLEVDIDCTILQESTRNLPLKVIMNVNGNSYSKLDLIAPNQNSSISFSSTLSSYDETVAKVDIFYLDNGDWTYHSEKEISIIAVNPNEPDFIVPTWNVFPDIPRPGHEISVEVTIIGSSKVDEPNVKITLHDAAGGGIPLIATSSEIILQTGELDTIEFKMNWPISCDNFEIEIEVFDGISELQIPSNLENRKTLNGCPNYYPNLVIDDITLLSNDSVKIDVSNDGGIPTSKETELAIFSDGSILGYVSIPKLEVDETANLYFIPENDVTYLTVVLDHEDRISESDEHSDNVLTKSVEVEIYQFSELDINLDGELDDSEAANYRILDSDGDGLSDEIELQGWDVKTVTHYSKLLEFQSFMEHLSGDDPSLKQPPSIRTVKHTSSTNSIDSDGDGLTDYGEFMAGSNPYSPDTDGDGLSDLEEVNDPAQDPLVVELDGAEVEALAPVRVSKGLKKDFRLYFTVNEPNLNSVEIIVTDGNKEKSQIPQIVEDQGIQNQLDSDGILYSVVYSARTFSFIKNVTVLVNVTDNFGYSSIVEIANHDSMRAKVTNSLAKASIKLADVMGGEDNIFVGGLAAITGVIYGIITAIQDIIDFGMGILKFAKLMTTEFASTMSSLLVGIREMMDGFDPSAIIDTGKEIYGALIEKVKSMSPFLDNVSNQTFLVAFILTFLAATKAIDALTAGTFSAAKATLRATESALGAFTTTVADELKGIKKILTQNPITTMKDIALLPLSIAKNVILTVDTILSSILVRGIISNSPFKVLFEVLGNFYMWVGKKLDLPGSHRVGRAIDLMDDWKELSRLSPKDLKKVLRQSRTIINNPDLFAKMDGFAKLEDGANYQKAAMKNLRDAMVSKGGKLKNLDSDTFRGTLNELTQIGVVFGPNGEKMVTVATGKYAKGGTGYDRDLTRVVYDSDGNIVKVIEVDAKHSKSGGSRGQVNKATKEHNGQGIADYQDDKFKENFLDNGEQGKQDFIDHMSSKTGMSKKDAEDLFEAKRKCALKITSNCDAKYETTSSKDSKISDISTKDCTTACGTAQDIDFQRADKNIKGYVWDDATGDFIPDFYNSGDIDPVTDVLAGVNKIEAQSATYVLAEPVTELTTFAKALIAVGASVSALIGIIILFRVIPRKPKMNSI